MRLRSYRLFVMAFLAFLLAGCSDDKQTKTTGSEDKVTTDDKTSKDVIASTGSEIDAPDFTDPELKKYYGVYTAYLKKVVTSIRDKDEAGTMKIFTEEGKQFNNRNEMDEKARSAEEQKYTAWLLQTIPYQKIIVESDYYKKFNEEYYKKVKENFEKKNY
ncbi:MAG: hypothetical protein H7Y01_03070 [Ferruginibacter sp.]|nr:hypothetical protein [Chitinophagaceae bacterium]